MAVHDLFNALHAHQLHQVGVQLDVHQIRLLVGDELGRGAAVHHQQPLDALDVLLLDVAAHPLQRLQAEEAAEDGAHLQVVLMLQRSPSVEEGEQHVRLVVGTLQLLVFRQKAVVPDEGRLDQLPTGEVVVKVLGDVEGLGEV